MLPSLSLGTLQHFQLDVFCTYQPVKYVKDEVLVFAGRSHLEVGEGDRDVSHLTSLPPLPVDHLQEIFTQKKLQKALTSPNLDETKKA